MRAYRRLLIAAAVAVCLPQARGAPSQPRPYVAYLCAAGGQQGTVVRIVAGGQNLRGVKQVYVSGTGVHAKVVGNGAAFRLLKPDQRSALARKLRRLAAQRLAEVTGQADERKRARRRPARNPRKKPPKEEPAELPDHPMLRHLDEMGLKDLRKVRDTFLDPARRSQLGRQLAEAVEIEVVISPDAAPGERELRLWTARGLSNPRPFHVGLLPENYEEEPNDNEARWQPIIEPPCVVNGQVGFKDIDRFRFRAARGQKLVIRAEARRLIPYLADAVPGWFQATLSLHDAKGRRIHYGDDYRFDPDPVLFFDVPGDGEYVLEIRDAIDRGRVDFVYRITVAEQPFITQVFPLGGRSGVPTVATVKGWNLPWEDVWLDTLAGAQRIRAEAWRARSTLSNRVHYAVDDIGDCVEVEPNDTPDRAQWLDLPRIVNGRIGTPGETDLFRFVGRAGEEIVAAVEARNLDSPLDSLLRLTDAAGRVLAWNDDHPDRGAGLVTHQADSYLSATLPARGTYRIQLTDAQSHGGEDYAYRLRVGPPQPDFELRVTPSSVNAPAGGLVPIMVHAVRKDGFAGVIDLELKDAPPGFALRGGRVPGSRDRVRVTLKAPRWPLDRPFALEIVGRAQIGERTIRRLAVPADDQMQAFGLRHLVPAQQLLVGLQRSGGTRSDMKVLGAAPVCVPTGGSARALISLDRLPGAALARIQFKLSDPPPGVTLGPATAEGKALVLEVRADLEKAQVGFEDNLIVEAYTEVVDRKPAKQDAKKGGKGKKGAKAQPAKGSKSKAKTKAKDAAKPAGAKQKAGKQAMRLWYMGVLPAIPIKIVPGHVTSS